MKIIKKTRSYHLHIKHPLSICYIIVAVVVSRCYTPQTIWEICFFPPGFLSSKHRIFHEMLVFMNHVSKYVIGWDTITITSFCQKPPPNMNLLATILTFCGEMLPSQDITLFIQTSASSWQWLLVGKLSSCIFRVILVGLEEGGEHLWVDSVSTIGPESDR